jgi:hypothetical protein
MRPSLALPLALAVLLPTCAPAPAAAPATATGSAPATASATARPAYADVLIPDVPHVHQRPDFCGEACVEMALRKLGHPLDQDEVFARSGVNPALGRGAYTPELKTALESVGFDPGAVWFQVDEARADAELSTLFAAMYEDLRAGVPSIVCMHYGDGADSPEHFRLIVGYDAAADAVIYHEPAQEGAAYQRMPRSRFFALWPLKYKASTWTVIRFRLAPRDLSLATPAPATAGFSKAAYAQHVLALKEQTLPRLRGGFTVVVEPPFVVIGDGPAERVRASAARTVRWATEKLKQDYFTRDPERILDVWLFKDADSYDRHAPVVSGKVPDTPYGYYTAEHGALVMNIATGGGTLVHEIVHPFIEANFPDCPPWLNEGLGSLYEQSAEQDGHIKGLTNWRLAGLQAAIRKGRAPRFADLCAMDAQAFYDDDHVGTNYAAARYLLYYLQEQGLLQRFYREAYADRGIDPTGYRALVRVLGDPVMSAFQRRWESFVLGLSFP